MIEEILAFYKARLDEDAELVRRNSDGNGLSEGWPDYRTYDTGDTEAADAYISRFGPVRRLREIDADRQIIARYEENPVHEWPLFPLLLRVEIYDDHPDYDERWRP